MKIGEVMDAVTAHQALIHNLEGSGPLAAQAMRAWKATCRAHGCAARLTTEDLKLCFNACSACRKKEYGPRDEAKNQQAAVPDFFARTGLEAGLRTGEMAHYGAAAAEASWRLLVCRVPTDAMRCAIAADVRDAFISSRKSTAKAVPELVHMECLGYGVRAGAFSDLGRIVDPLVRLRAPVVLVSLGSEREYHGEARNVGRHLMRERRARDRPVVAVTGLSQEQVQKVYTEETEKWFQEVLEYDSSARQRPSAGKAWKAAE